MTRVAVMISASLLMAVSAAAMLAPSAVRISGDDIVPLRIERGANEASLVPLIKQLNENIAAPIPTSTITWAHPTTSASNGTSTVVLPTSATTTSTIMWANQGTTCMRSFDGDTACTSSTR